MFEVSDVEMVLRLAAALLLGGTVGFDREIRDRSAGIRTHALAAEGAAIFTLAGILIAKESSDAGIASVDPTRIAAAVVSGIGFLAAGVILARRERVQGLTTAAGIWVTAGIGVLCGAGFFLVAIAATVATTVVLSGLKVVEKRWMEQEDETRD